MRDKSQLLLPPAASSRRKHSSSPARLDRPRAEQGKRLKQIPDPSGHRPPVSTMILAALLLAAFAVDVVYAATGILTQSPSPTAMPSTNYPTTRYPTLAPANSVTFNYVVTLDNIGITGSSFPSLAINVINSNVRQVLTLGLNQYSFLYANFDPTTSILVFGFLSIQPLGNFLSLAPGATVFTFNQTLVDDYEFSSTLALSGENFITGLRSGDIAIGLQVFTSSTTVTSVVVGVGSPTAAPSPTAFLNGNSSGSSSNSSKVNYDLLGILVIPILGTAAVLYWLYSHINAKKTEEHDAMLDADV